MTTLIEEENKEFSPTRIPSKLKNDHSSPNKIVHHSEFFLNKDENSRQSIISAARKSRYINSIICKIIYLILFSDSTAKII